MELGVSGLISGFDWRTLVDQLTEVERAPQRRLRAEQSRLQAANTAYGSLKTQLEALKAKVDALKTPAFFQTRLAKVSDPSLASATAAAGVPVGEYTVHVAQFATAATQWGQANVGNALQATNDVSGLVLSGARLARPITAGTFTVNGKQVTIATTDTLQQVFDKISSATGGAVTASYDAATDKITLVGADTLTLGSAADTSNFLMAAKLYNNGTSTVTSAGSLGVVQPQATLGAANFATPVSDGGGGQGLFKINGVAISFNAATDTVQNVLDRINNSQAGVTASYDAAADRFVLTNQKTGDLGVALEDVTGNFLAAAGLLDGSLERGKNALYTLNGGPTLVSQSNTLTDQSHGIAGLNLELIDSTVTTFSVSVRQDTAQIKAAINDFIAEYNKTQALIDTQTASSTDAKGKVTAGVLANQSDVDEIARKLRSLTNGPISGLSGAVRQLEQLGFASNGNDNSLGLSDSAKLDDALANHLVSVAELFSASTNGLAVQVSAFLDKTVGESGTLLSRQSNLTKQSSTIDTQVAEQERQVQALRQRLIDSFIAMEKAQAQINQQMQFLLQRFGTR